MGNEWLDLLSWLMIGLAVLLGVGTVGFCFSVYYEFIIRRNAEPNGIGEVPNWLKWCFRIWLCPVVLMVIAMLAVFIKQKIT